MPIPILVENEPLTEDEAKWLCNELSGVIEANTKSTHEVCSKFRQLLDKGVHTHHKIKPTQLLTLIFLPTASRRHYYRLLETVIMEKQLGLQTGELCPFHVRTLNKIEDLDELKATYSLAKDGAGEGKVQSKHIKEAIKVRNFQKQSKLEWERLNSEFEADVVGPLGENEVVDQETPIDSETPVENVVEGISDEMESDDTVDKTDTVDIVQDKKRKLLNDIKTECKQNPRGIKLLISLFDYSNEFMRLCHIITSGEFDKAAILSMLKNSTSGIDQ